MRHTNSIVSVGHVSYSVSKEVIEQVQALLRRNKARPLTEYTETVSLDEAFPEVLDPIMGPAHYLRGVRLRENLTQTQLAEKAGMKQSHISEMERGKRPIGKESAKKLAAILNANWRAML